MILALAAWTAWLVATLGLGRLLAGKPRPEVNAVIDWARVLGLGLGGFATLWFYLSLAGVPLNAVLLLTTAGPAALYFVVTLGSPRRGLTEDRSHAMILLVLACVFLSAAQAWWEPLISWDARSHWTFLAQILYYEQSVNGPTFLHPDAAVAHQSYPLLIPLQEWALFAWRGETDDHLVRLACPAIYAGLLAATYGAARLISSHHYSLVTVGTVGSIPLLTRLMDGGASSGYADVPLAFFATLAVGCLLEWSRTGGTRSLIMASVFAWFCIFTKREGLPLGLLCLLLAPLLDRRIAVWKMLAACLGLALPWLIHWRQLPIDYQLVARSSPLLQQVVERLPELAFIYFRDLWLRPERWAGAFWVASACVFLPLRYSAVERYLLALFVLYWSVHVGTHLLSPLELTAYNMDTRSRTLFHGVPALALCCCARARRWIESTPPTDNRPTRELQEPESLSTRAENS